MNKVILLGRLTHDPELKYTKTNNKEVTTFSLAVNRPFKKDEADFFTIQAWGSTAEFVCKFMRKGSQIALVGRLQNRTWQDKDGKNHNITEIIAEEVYFADSKLKGQDTEELVIDGSENWQTNIENEEDDDLPF